MFRKNQEVFDLVEKRTTGIAPTAHGTRPATAIPSAIPSAIASPMPSVLWYIKMNKTEIKPQPLYYRDMTDEQKAYIDATIQQTMHYTKLYAEQYYLTYDNLPRRIRDYVKDHGKMPPINLLKDLLDSRFIYTPPNSCD